ncbi:MAG: LPS biosynthesis protein WbpP [Elusimicrobia bacterium CG11_big_fil_rev_8_21_14_0_20_64_6]|nr:MAG: LPS biosynthesis protein WbpP [Elusimicrobia bacterium CG11_big_fil_rev_8_21_14_0_20_64_6]
MKKSLWLVTGGAGFIGSHIAAELVRRGERVRIIDNLSTGTREKLAAIGGGFEFQKGDITRLRDCEKACKGATYILHQAAIRSVPKSMDRPIPSNEANVAGTLNMLIAARDAKVKRFVYASSSSAYGNCKVFPQREDMRSQPMSPYAVSKLAAEHYAIVFAKSFGLETVSLRYFNVFGPRQDPESLYSAVIPKFMEQAYLGVPLDVHWDGKQSRDFTFVANVVRANILAAKGPKSTSGEVYNVANSETYSLLDVVEGIEGMIGRKLKRRHHPMRGGDVRRTWADNRKIRKQLGYRPVVSFDDGLRLTWNYFVDEYFPKKHGRKK